MRFNEFPLNILHLFAFFFIHQAKLGWFPFSYLLVKRVGYLWKIWDESPEDVAEAQGRFTLSYCPTFLQTFYGICRVERDLKASWSDDMS